MDPPVYDEDTTQIAEYEGVGTGCHYNFQDYEEGDRIMTNEPCLNCTCHNRMLMCYLRVCPQFTKAIGQNCKVEKRPDQCCPVITCPEVPVQLLTSTTSAPSDLTEVGFHDNYGCSINNKFYADGAQLPTDPNNPCELCYCIRNRTTCTMQQCTLNIAQCNPVYHVGICCPVKYDCDYNEETKTTLGTTPGLIMTTTITPDVVSPRCFYKGKMFKDGDLLYSTEPCHHCYCFRGDIACAIQDCGKPMETHGKNCTASTPPEGECCPTTYECESTNESAEGEDQQKVTHDENEIVATQASLPMKGEDVEQKYEDFPGANNAISQDSQVHEEITIKSIESITTTEGTIEKENNQIPEKTTPTSVFKDNAVPQESIMPVIHVDEATQSSDEFTTPTKPIESIEIVGQTQSTTNSNEVEAMKTPANEKPADVLEVDTESSIPSSEKPSTNLPARSEDQFPLQQPTAQPTEILTTIPNTENEFSETAVTVPVITETENNNKVEEEPITHVLDSNEIPKVPKSDEETKVEETAIPEEITTIKVAAETEKKQLDEAETEASSSEMPEASTESKPEAEVSGTEMPEAVNEDELTTHRSAAPDITNRIPEQDSTTTDKLEDTPEEATTTHSIAEQPMSTQTVPTTEIVESEITDIPTEGPSGIVTVTRGSVNKDDDNESVPEVQVTEGYDKQGVSEETQTAENLMTDKPETPMEISTEAPVLELEKKTEKPQVSATEPTALITETAAIEPETKMPSEHIQRIPPTPIDASTTQGPIEHGEQSTKAVESEETPTTYSTEAFEDEIPMKGLEVSGEKSSEEAMRPGTSTEVDKQPESSEESLEEDGEMTNSPFLPIEQSTSTEFSTEVKNEITTEEQITELSMEKDTIIPKDEKKPVAGKPAEEKSTEETLTEEELMKEKPAEEKPILTTLPESVEQTPTTEIQTLKTDQDQTTLRPQESSTAIIEEEILTSTFNESSSTSVPVGIEHTEGTTIAEELIEPSVTSTIPESLTKDTNIDKIPSDISQSTELPVLQENSTEMEQSIQPAIDETPEIKPEEAMKPTDESISTSEQPITKFDESDNAVKQQTEFPIILEEIKPTEMSVVEEKPVEGVSLTPIDLPMNEPTEVKPTSSPITEIQTIGAVTKPTITEKETLEEDEVQQTQKPSIVSEETEISVTGEKSTEPTILEKEPNEESNDQIATSTEQDLKPEENPTEAIIVAVTVPETNELSTDTQPELKPEESSSEKTNVTPLLKDQEKLTETPISEEQPISITTESSISEEKSTENTITSEIMPISVTEQQPNEEPVKITDISTETPTDDTIHTQSNIPEESSSKKPISTPADNFEPEKRPIETSVANVTHAEVIPVEITEEPTLTSISTKEPTFELTSELSPESIATTIEDKESGEFHETSEIPSKSVTEPSVINEETTANSELPNESLSNVASTGPVIADEQTTVFGDKQTEKPEKNQEEISPSLTTTPTFAIEKGTTLIIPYETEVPVEKIQTTTDALVSESSTILPTKEEKPELIPYTEQQSEISTESSIQSVESTDKFAKEPSSSTETSDEILPTTSEDLKPLGIPGEGNCLIDGETFTNNSSIPPINSCQISCRCVSSIVQCESVQCPPPPKHHSRCMPVLMHGETCCPTYTCETVPTSSLEVDNQMAEEHLTTEKQVHEQETKAPLTDEISSADATVASEVMNPSEEQVTLFYDQKESTSVTPTESSSTVESEINVTVEPSDNAPEISNESTEYTKSPEIITKEGIPEIEVTSATLLPDEIELTKPAESDKKHIVPSFDNRVNEDDKVTTAPGEEMDTKIEPTSDSHVPVDDEQEVVSVLNADDHSVSIPNNTQTESATIITEKIDEPSLSTEVNDAISTDTSEFVTQSSSEAQEISTIGEETSVTKENPTTTLVEKPIENIKETSEKSQEGSSSSEDPSELTPTSTVDELSTENSSAEKTGLPLPETNKTDDNVSLSGEEQTTESISTDIEMTVSPLVKEPDVKSQNGTLPVSDTAIPIITEEHKDVSEKPVEVPKTEIPEEQAVTIVPADDKILVPAIPQDHSITEEITTADAISEETTEPFIISQEQAEKSTESPQSLETASEPVVVEHTSSSTDPAVPSETATSSIALENSEQTKPSITEIYKEQTVEPVSSELTETSISEFNVATTPSMIEAEVTDTSIIMNKPEEEHTSSAALPNVTETEELSEKTTETISPSTESSLLESESIEGETEQSSTTSLASIVPVESELSTEKYHTEVQEKTTEGVTSITQTPGMEISQTETAITSDKTSETPIAVDEQLNKETLGTQPSLTQEISPELMNASIIVTEKSEEATKLPEEVTSSISVSPELTTVPKIPSEEHILPTEAPAETTTDFSNKEPSTEVSAEATESPTTPSVISDTAEFEPVSQENPIKTSVEDEKEITTGIKVETPSPTIVEISTAEITKKTEALGTISPIEDTLSTVPSSTVESSMGPEEISPMTSQDEKPTNILTDVSDEPTSTPAILSSTKESVTQSTVVELITQPSTESFDEHTMTPIKSETSEEPSVIETHPPKIPEHTIDETKPADLPLGPIEDDIQHPISDPSLIFEHAENEGQQPINPLESEIVQEHVTETEKNLTSVHHGYIPPSTTEAPIGSEYPEQSVSDEDNPHFPINGGTHLNPEEDYDEDDQAVYGPGTCRYGGKVYVSAQQIPRDDPCDFCFCFRGDIICLQQSCPPPIPGCHEEPISGFCCPRYECPVSMATSLNITTTTTTTTTTLPPHFLSHAYKGATRRSGCQIRGQAYKVGEVIQSASGPCLHCICGGDGNMKCEPRICTPEPMIRQMIAAATAKRRR
ncbi:hypothetical protein PV325_013233 [Microctonus aethiopoides]|nr:hypothetical protein PV325_013233 [Microctonus aethiopoides]